MRIGPGSVVVAFALLFVDTMAGVMVHRWQAWRDHGPQREFRAFTAVLEEVRDPQVAAQALARWDATVNAREESRQGAPVRIALVDPQGRFIYRSAAHPVAPSALGSDAPDCAESGPLQAWCWLGAPHPLGRLTAVYPGVDWVGEARSAAGLAFAIAIAGAGAWVCVALWMGRRQQHARAAMEQQWALESTTQLCRTAPGGGNRLHALSRMNAARERLANRLRVERAFVQDAAHELRTPLAALRVQVHQLRRATPSGEPDPVVTAVDRSAQRMARMTEQLLQWARLQDGDAAAAAPKAPVDVVELIREGLADLAPQALGRGMDLTLDAPPSWWGTTDPVALDCVVRNLVDNAIRYGRDAGRVRVAIEPVSPAEVHLIVEDDGPGIAPELRERVFERFVRASDRPGGSGLGLSIVKRCLPRLGGRISLQTGPSGRGCAFSVRFECVAVGAHPAGALAVPPDPTPACRSAGWRGPPPTAAARHRRRPS